MVVTGSGRRGRARTALLAALVVGGGAILAACGGGGASPTSGAASQAPAGSASAGPPGSSAAGGAVDVCRTLTIEEVMEAVGGTDPQGAVTSTDDHSDCTYTFSTPSTSGPLGWQVDVQVWDSSAWAYQQGLPSDDRAEVPGLGDEAFTQSDVGERDLWVRQGDRVLSFATTDRDGTQALLEAIAKVAIGAL